MKQKTIQYLDLKNDRSFRRFFSTHKGVLFSLINSFLPISTEAPDGSTVNSADLHASFDDLLYLRDTSISPDTPSGKQSVLDLYATLGSGESVNIEMQNYVEEDFGDRMLAYWIRSAPPLKRGQKPAQAKPSYCLAFTNFNASSGAHYISRANILWDNPKGEKMTKRFLVVAVQLNKFNKSLYELVDMADRWCYIIKHSVELTAEQVKYLSRDGETGMVLEHLAEMSKDDAEYLRETVQLKREWEDLSRKEELEKRARVEGMQEGRVQGMQEGRVQGMQEGEVKRDREIALGMLQKGYEVSEISEVTGLSVAEIEQLNGRAAD